ncbi:MAG: hypothetical protein ABSF08_08190 [Candidatus Cybelea sp.]
MNVRHLLGAGLVAAAVPLLLGGCASTASSTTPGVTSPMAAIMQARKTGHSTLILPIRGHDPRVAMPAHSWIKPPQPHTRLYVSDAEDNVVNIYNANGTDQTPIGQLTGFDEPQGLWVDVNQNLWVVNTNTYQIMGFHRNASTPFKTFNDTSGGYPAGACGNDNKNLLYAVDILGPSFSNGNTIEVFNKAGSSSPIQILTDPNASSLNGCVVDSKGNLFVTLTNVNYPYAGEVDVFLKNATTPIVLVDNLVYPIGITIDKYRALAVQDTFAMGYSGGEMYLYDPPYTSGPAYSFATPSGVIETALNKPQTQIWGANGYDVVAQEFSYPHGLLQNQTSSQDLSYPDGLALSPAAKQ